MAGRCGVQHCLQIGMDRDCQLGPGLLLLHVDHSAVRGIADVLPPHADNIASPLCGVDQQGQRQPLPRPDRMPRLEGGNVVLVPSTKAIGLAGQVLIAIRR